MTPSGAGAQESAVDAYAASIGRALLRSDLVAVVALDPGWRIVEFSAGAEALFARRRESTIGATLGELIVSPLLRAARRGSAEPPLLANRTEHTGVRGDQTHFPVEMSIIGAGDQRLRLFVCFLRDLSERRLSDYRLASSQALLAEAEELAGAGSFERDLRSGSVVWSAGMYRVLGLSPGAEPPPSLEKSVELLHPDDRPGIKAALHRIMAEHQPRFCEQVRVLRPDREPRIVELRGKVVFDDFGEAERLIGTARDITEEVEGRRTRDLLSYVVESSDDAIITKTPGGIISSWNRGAERLYGYRTAEAVGQHISLIVPPDADEQQAEITRQVFSGRAVHQLETSRIRKDGTDVPVSLSISPVRDDRGEIVSAAVIGRDVTERRHYELRLRALAEHDHLTGLLNRRRFEEELRRELSRAERSGEGGAVVSVDLDGFKAINDTAGHAAGDAVLRAVANALSAHSRQSDVVARLGGDEFAVLLPNAGREQAQAAAEHLLEAVH